MAVDLETRVKKTAQRLYKRMGEEKPALFRKDTWAGKAIELCLGNDAFKTAFFRFIDVFPYLMSPQSLSQHVQEYFCTSQVRVEAEALGIVCAEPATTAALDTASVLSVRLMQLAKIFIAGTTPEEAAPIFTSLRSLGAAISGDILGEAAVSEKEADAHVQKYLDFLEYLRVLQESWPPLGSGTLNLDWGHTPRINISVKPSALYSQMRAVAFDHSVDRAKERLRAIYQKAVKLGAYVVMDMEQRDLKSMTLALYRSLNDEPEFRDYPHTGIIVQTYLKECERDLEDLLQWARRHNQRFTVRLVKGAYWEAEMAAAAQRSWAIPIFQNKHQTDLNFERLSRRLMENHPFLDFACASQNMRTVAWVLENAKELKVPPERLEFQVLHGMADPLLKALLEEGLRVRVYAPIGELAPGMAYLIRRLMECTSRESFLAKAFSGGDVDSVELFRNPQELPVSSEQEGVVAVFRNEPCRDWALPEHRERFTQALAAVREKMPYRLALVIGGGEVKAASDTRKAAEARREIVSVNPNNPEEVVGFAPCARRKETLAAVEAAARAFPAWRDADPGERIQALFRAAAAARSMRDELAALQVLEAGKAWEEADAETCEAIDYLEYYARQMLRLSGGNDLGVQGESSRLFYCPRGVAAVIAPWNFPLAISMGMTSAALVAGNTVVYKPSSLTPVTGSMVFQIFAQAGLPPGVLSFLPGPGSLAGDLLANHPEVALIAFTGSKEVGLRIVERAYRIPPHAGQVRSVVAELGGKNAVIIDADADLDEAVVQVVRSAFGYQGQKCSACSLVIVLEEIYARFLERLKAAAESIELGPVEEPKNLVGALIDRSAQEKIQRYIDAGKKEGKSLLLRKPASGPGYNAPLAIFHDVPPQARIAVEEIFGPVLSVLKAKDFDHALAIADASQYALTGGLFSRSPENIRRAAREFRVGNLYINRGITGAVVGRHPFGGFKLSGLGTKAGGPDYLLHFLLPRCLTENTVRHGFVPEPGPS